MGSRKLTVEGCRKMLKLACLLLSLSLVKGANYPANLSPAACVNYPFCGPTPGVPEVPGVMDTLSARQAVIQEELKLINMALAKVPGFHNQLAEEAKVRAVQITQGPA